MRSPCPEIRLYPISPAFDDRVAFPGTRRTTRQLTYRHRCYPVVSAIPRTACKTVLGSPSTTSGSHPSASPLAPWSTVHPSPRRATRRTSSKEAQELGTLHPTLVLAFHFFSLVPSRLPNWAGTHDDVPAIEWSLILRSTNPHAVLLPLVGTRSFRSPSLCLPSHPTRRRMRTLDIAPSPSDWWLPLALASNLYHLPIRRTVDQVSLSGVRCVRHPLRSTGCRPY